MAYQRFGDDSDLYIWTSVDALNVWIANFEPKTKTIKTSKGGLTELEFNDKNLDEAVNLFRALYDHLTDNGAVIEINKKRKELKIRGVK
jgi:hypothetical protein